VHLGSNKFEQNDQCFGENFRVNFAMEQFDFSFLYGGEIYYSWNNLDFFFDYRFTIGWNVLKMPTYVYLPLLDGEEELIDNSPVELKNQSYAFSIGILF